MKEVLVAAKREIIELRRRNELLMAQMAVVEIFAAALGLKRGERAMVPDIAVALENKIHELDLAGTVTGRAKR